MSSLSQQLAKLGIRPIEDGDPTPASVPDLVDALLSESFPWQSHGVDWHPTLIQTANDVQHTLEAWMLRLATRTAPHGMQLVHEFATPQVKDGSHYRMGNEIVESTSACKHMLVRINESVDVLMCRQCKMPVNPIWWISKYFDAVSKAEMAKRWARNEHLKLRQEIEELKAERSKHKQAIKRATERIDKLDKKGKTA